MATFIEAVNNQSERTTNGMEAFKTTGNVCVSLFFKIGASRGKNIIPDFTAAYVDNPNYALRIAQWARDVRGGAGERQIFRDILLQLSKTDGDRCVAMMKKVPELGRWDDLLIFEKDSAAEAVAFSMIADALEAGNGLCAKWMPRKGETAARLRSFLGWTPKFYRKRLVELTKVVEQQMCANDWENINFSHVPSVASARYKKAFGRHSDAYKEYIAALVRGDKNVKVNASAVYPYDVLKGLVGSYHLNYTKDQLEHVNAQWNALPNYVGDANILPLVDVSGSMCCRAGASGTTTCLDVAVSLGLYLADKNVGKFKDTFLTFSDNPQLLHLQGNILQKIDQMTKSNWQMSTNLHAALDKILKVAKDGNVPQEEMPAMLLILSDMQFNACTRFDDSAMQMIERKYENAGYQVPKIVFWNLNARDNVPVEFDKSGVAMVSGFSPSIVKSVLSGDMDNFTPEGIMLQTIMNPRYDI